MTHAAERGTGWALRNIRRLGACAVVLAVAACSQAHAEDSAAVPHALTAARLDRTGPAPAAATALAALPLRGRGSKVGYSRAQFGPAWADANANGCSTRNDVLARDLTSVVLRAGTHGCVVISGVLRSPYTGAVIAFTKAHASLVQIDHVVAEGDAWQSGAAALTPATRERLANDPLNLLAVDGFSNEQKRDSDAASWLPSSKAYRCAYIARQIAVKRRYALWVKPAERDAMTRVLSSCPGQLLPQGGLSAVSAPTTPSATPVPAQSSSPSSGDDVFYANCAAARAAGVTPLHRGDAGYRAGLDANHDGIACS